MDVEKFINLVYECKCLWDHSEPSYHLRDQQRRAWRDISKDMGVAVDELKKKWRGLRDTFGKELRKHYNKSGQAASEPDSNWIYFKRLLFLRSIMTRRDIKISVADSCEISYGEENNANNYTPFPVQHSEVSEENSKEFNPPLKKVKNNIAETCQISYAESDNAFPVQTLEVIEEASKEFNPPLKKVKNNIAETGQISYGKSGNAFPVQPSEVVEEASKEFNPPLKKKVKRWQINNIDARLLEIEEEKLKCFLKTVNDPDAQFLMSLIPFLNDIPRDRKLMVRAKLQQIFIDEQNAISTVLPD